MILIFILYLVQLCFSQSDFEKNVRKYCEPLMFTQTHTHQFEGTSAGISFTFKNSEYDFTMVVGNAGPKEPVTEKHRFLFGSLTKMVTGAAIMKVVSEGKLELDKPVAPIIDPWLLKNNKTKLSQIYGPAEKVNSITTRQLLAMQSGIGDFDTPTTDEYQWKNRSYDIPPVEDLYLAPLELTCDFCGNYSSTNFVILGILLATLDGKDAWEDYDQHAVFPEDAPYRDELIFAKHGDCSEYATEENPVCHGVCLDGKTPTDVYDLSATGGWTCGNTIGTTSAMASFTWDLFGPEKKVIPEKYVDMMHSNWTALDAGWFRSTYGLATMLFSNSTARGGYIYGHGGATFGFTSVSVYNADFDFVVTIAGNRDVTYGGGFVYEVFGRCMQKIEKLLEKTSSHSDSREPKFRENEKPLL